MPATHTKVKNKKPWFRDNRIPKGFKPTQYEYELGRYKLVACEIETGGYGCMLMKPGYLQEPKLQRFDSLRPAIEWAMKFIRELEKGA